MKSLTLCKVQILVLLVDHYWKPGAIIRAKEIERRLFMEKGIELAEKTVHNILDSLVGDSVLVRSPLGREKLYSINEDVDRDSVKTLLVETLGIGEWVKARTRGQQQLRRNTLADVVVTRETRNNSGEPRGGSTRPERPSRNKPRI